MANVGLFLCSIFLAFLLAEIGIRLFGAAEVNERALMFSSYAFQLDQNGAVRYQSNSAIRTVAVYGDSIEYDVRFDTNNLGLVDDKDYEYEDSANKRHYAFVGDSFTAGFHGGDAWIPALRRRVEAGGVEIFNLGVSGAGFEHFYRLLQSTREQIPLTHIVILAISGDFGRGFWYPLTNASEIRFCPENVSVSECGRRPYTARIIDSATSSAEVLEIAGGMREAREGGPQEGGIIGMLKQSKLLTLVARSARTVFQDRKGDSVQALRKIREAFPSAEIHLIHLPQKQEVEKGSYSLRGMGYEIEAIGISYFPALRECDWREDMFFVHDNHPNQPGYDNIRECVSGYLFRR